ncbi:MAG: phosphodiester glycosidase family protein [Symploca sp. SIO2C1]|nr:phosphodiester glycosidase family protein [Symploca sp. SIO2C1]
MTISQKHGSKIPSFPISTKQLLVATTTGLLTLPLIFYGWLHLSRPPRTPQKRSLFQGIVYQREVRSTPRPLILHLVTIDLTAPGVRVLVTPGKPTPDNTAVNARTTTEFLSEFKLQLAINGSFFYPFREVSPWDYYPKSGDRVNVVGEAIAKGASYSASKPNWPVLCFNANNRTQIESSGKCPKGTIHGVAGNVLLVERGNPIGLNLDSRKGDFGKPYPRVAVAIDEEGKKLWLIAVDGKQPLYSEGATIAELTKIILDLGAYSALNLDGGGSTTLVTATSKQPTVLNAPIHTKLPMRQRPVANHLGFYALPQNP